MAGNTGKLTKEEIAARGPGRPRKNSTEQFYDLFQRMGLDEQEQAIDTLERLHKCMEAERCRPMTEPKADAAE